MGRKAGIALVLALLFFTASCNLARRSDRPAPVDTGPRVYGDPNSTASPPASPTAAEAAPPPAGGGQTGGRRSGGGSTGGGSTTGGGSATSGGATAASFSDLGNVGDAARPMLRPEPYTEIVIEIDYVAGAEPDQEAVDYMVRTLRQVTGKRVVLQGGGEIDATDGTTSGEECARRSQMRETRSGGSRVSLHISFLNGRDSRSSRILGFAESATVICLFPERWRTLSNVNNYAVEGTVILHEVGHLLAQTEIGYVSPRPRKDEAHGDHTRNESSVMYWAAETTGITSVVRGSQPLAFDADDLADFRDMAAGRL